VNGLTTLVIDDPLCDIVDWCEMTNHQPVQSDGPALWYNDYLDLWHPAPEQIKRRYDYAEQVTKAWKVGVPVAPMGAERTDK
jgi:hypothetical protein